MSVSNGFIDGDVLYVVRLVKLDNVPESYNFMPAAFTSSGEYIGNPKDAERICVDRGIRPQYRKPDSGVCSIGFCEREQKWYGWSHRAMYGFGVGYRVESNDSVIGSEYPDEIGRTVTSLDEAKRMAELFAEAAS